MVDRRAYDPYAPAPTLANPAPVEPAAPEPDAPTATDLDDIAAQVPDDLDEITKPDLIALAELADVPTYGTKAEIAQRIRDAAAAA